MSLEPYTCELDNDTGITLKVYLFKNVINVEVIRANIIKGMWKCAVIKPTLILDPFQVAVAANRAVVADKLKTMVTKTIFAEILYNLSLTKNISHSLSKFGIEKDRDLLVCFLAAEGQDESEDILSQIEGEQCPISELCNFTNIKDVKNVYKLSNNNKQEGMLDVIVSRMVTKNFVSH